ncbi:hypothetical protein [Halopiger djelfimassiliensis]|uniref:hypothetical protein n=1 Tax=Halopiger djelfimassiliensis TaxID=1293047 RepID=UPI000677A33E|nr:hypothetical protein [Halopiger djelfimassiliensis]
MGTGKPGFDVVARNPRSNGPDELIIIIESKYYGDNSPQEITTTGYLREPEKGTQMGEDWVEETIDKLEERATTPEQQNFVDELRESNTPQNEEKVLRKELVVVQDRPKNGKTVDGGLASDVGLDDVDVVKLGEVIGE